MQNNWQLLRDGTMSWDNFKLKSKLMRSLREFLWSRNFLEIDTPILSTTFPIEPNIYLSPVTWLHKEKTFYLAPSPEFALKRALAAGSGNCFAISKCVRDLEDLGPTHNLEFNMLEFYQVNADYNDVALTIKDLFNRLEFPYPWEKTTVKELFAKHAHINLDDNLTTASIIKTAQAKGYNTTGVSTWEPLFNQIWANEIEPNLPQKTGLMIFDYPSQISTLCQPCPDPRYGQRFEFYIDGLEFGNCYSELTDPVKQLENFHFTMQERDSLSLPNHPLDTNLVDALSSLPRCSGIAIGIERLVMFFAGTKNINDVVFMPTSQML